MVELIGARTTSDASVLLGTVGTVRYGHFSNRFDCAPAATVTETKQTSQRTYRVKGYDTRPGDATVEASILSLLVTTGLPLGLVKVG